MRSVWWAAIAVVQCLTGCEKQPHEDVTLVDKIHRLELQRMCAEQASKAFKDAGWDANSKSMPASFMDHYDFKSERCYIFVASTSNASKSLVNSESINDAFTQDAYGEFDTATDYTATVPAPHIMSCVETAPGSSQNNCTTADEWKAYKAKFGFFN